MSDLSSKTKREALKARREPYWSQLAKGQYVGYRRGADTWVARYRDREGSQHYHALGEHADYASAKAAAEAWLSQMGQSARKAPKRGTVREALAAYVAHMRRQGRDSTADEAEARFRLVMHDEEPLAELALDAATRDDFETWRDGLRAGRQARSVNRHVRAIAAALNLATTKLAHVGNRAAWTLDALPDDVDDTGEGAVFLDQAQRARMIAKAPAALAAFLTALEHTGARPSEMAGATVADFDAAGGSLALKHRKGKPAKVRARRVELSSDGVEFFKRQARSKLPSAPLVGTAAGRHWRRHEWARGIREAIAAANAKVKPKQRIPTAASAYSFRHARISELLQVYGVDPLTVAMQTGTSMAMMERYYWRFVPAALRAKFDAVAKA